MNWYYVITDEMRTSLGLKGNELLVFAIINGYSQSQQGCFYGSLAYLQELTGAASKRTIITTLQDLVAKGHIVKREMMVDGVRRVLYTVADGWCKKCTVGSAEIAPGGSANFAPNNKGIDNKEGDIKGASRFVKPTVEEVRAYCRERGNDIDPAEFVDFYASKGWMVGSSPMKDWRACVRTWERSHAKGRASNRTAAPGRPKNETLGEMYKRIYRELNADEPDYHTQTYGASIDEQ